MANFPLINNSHGDDTRNILNAVIRYLNDMGYTYEESIQMAKDILRDAETKSNAILNEAEKVNARNVDTNNRLDIALSQLPSDSEVVDARRGEITLGRKNDKQDENITQAISDTVRRTRNLEPAKLSGAETLINSDGHTLLNKFDGYIWSHITGDGIYRKNVDNIDGNWQLYTSSVPSTGGSLNLIPTNDDEVILFQQQHIYKSSGWEDGNVTWTLKLEPNASALYYPFNVDGFGSKFIASEYSATHRPDSRYVHISIDNGETWDLVYDSVNFHGSSLASASHLHGACYDRWRDRFYISEGHGEIVGIFVSENNGMNWTKPSGMIQSPAPTTITATPTGLVCGPDHQISGVYGITSLDDVNKQEIKLTWRWNVSLDGVVPFGWSTFYDEETEQVFIGFTSDRQEINTIIAAGTPQMGGMVYEWPWQGGNSRHTINKIIVNKGRLLARTSVGSTFYDLEGILDAPGVQTHREGNLIGGTADKNTSIAVGKDSFVPGIRSTAFGVGAGAIGSEGLTDAVSIGHNAKVNGTSGVSIGSKSSSVSTSVAIGTDSESSYSQTVVIGNNAKSFSGGGAIGIGNNVETRAGSVVIGHNASTLSGSINAVSLGAGAKSHADGVALGRNVETTRGRQLAIGNKHIEIENFGSENTGVVPDGKARLYVRENSEGKLELCAQFYGVGPRIIASQ